MASNRSRYLGGKFTLLIVVATVIAILAIAPDVLVFL